MLQFRKSYEELYTSKSSVQTEIDHFLDKLDFPIISEREKDLDRPISVKEIEHAIMQMRSGTQYPDQMGFL